MGVVCENSERKPKERKIWTDNYEDENATQSDSHSQEETNQKENFINLKENKKNKKQNFYLDENIETNNENNDMLIDSESDSDIQEEINQKEKLNENQKIEGRNFYLAQNIKKKNEEISNKISYKEEKYLINKPKYVNHKQSKEILEQMEKSICKIECKNHFGTGFFSYINLPQKLDLLPVLFTNNHILREEDISPKNIINISLNDDTINYKIEIDENTKTYTNKEHDTTIIEIKDKDIIQNVKFLYIDEDIYNFDNNQIKNYKNKTIYLLQYPKGEECANSFGVIKNITLNNYDLTYNCQSAYSIR